MNRGPDLTEIEAFLNEWLKDGPHFLVELALKKGDHIEVYIDSYEKFTHQDCIRVTRALQEKFGTWIHDYHLTVSSAGLDRPFKTTQQYHKNIGKAVKILLLDGQVVEGTLEGLTADGIRILSSSSRKKSSSSDYDEQLIREIPFAQIKSATRIIKF
ncbi:MAG: hypothetical protein NZM65_06970 [Flavobacteriales bacterium]|nr:hypothetical protein [Flavobacteriales bacterium]MDW8410415.1 hypothetical protein [Flavobacteriales bacterium]